MKSAETRQHLVRMVVVDGKSVECAALHLRISERSARRFLAYCWKTGGDFRYDPERWNRHADKVGDDSTLRDAVLKAFEDEPELFLDEMTDVVNALTAGVEGAVEISPASVSRILARNGYTRKIIVKDFLTCNEAERVAWVAAQWQIPLSCRVYIDETHRVGQAAERRWAWAVRGSQSECYVASSAGARKSFFAAMAHVCMLDWMITRLPPGQTAVEFLLFVTSFVLPRMRACVAGEWSVQPERGVLVLDNARIHDSVALASLRAAGVSFCSCLPTRPTSTPLKMSSL